jgi:hypothetical protein
LIQLFSGSPRHGKENGFSVSSALLLRHFDQRWQLPELTSGAGQILKFAWHALAHGRSSTLQIHPKQLRPLSVLGA